jgi:branched-chain amino acid transport system ATP-binding protein
MILRSFQRRNARENVSFLLAEQNTNMALKYARHGYILESGRDGRRGASAEKQPLEV